VSPGQELTLLLDHRAVTGSPDATLMLSWYNDTRGGSQAQTLVALPQSSDWATERVDVRVPANAVAVQPFIRLAPPSLSVAEIDVDEVRLIDWDEPGCDNVRGGATVTGRALRPEDAAPKLDPVEAHHIGVTPPPPLPPGPEARTVNPSFPSTLTAPLLPPSKSPEARR
jgi:hypothetical protein